jgi:ketosteroid isomerase-like protein
MRRNATLLNIFLTTVAIFIITVPDTKAQPEREILENEKQILKRWVNRDVWGFLESLSNDATYFDEGTNLKLKGIEEIKEYILPWDGKIYVPKHEFVNADIKILGSTGLLTYNLYNFNEKGDTTLVWNCTEIYEKRDNNWKIIHSHWSIVNNK